MEYRETTSTVAEWLIEEELTDYTAARFFLEDTLKEFIQDMEKFQYSLHLLYEAQKDIQSDLIGTIQSLRSCIPAIQNIHITVVMPPLTPPDFPFKKDIPPMSVQPYLPFFEQPVTPLQPPLTKSLK